MGYTDAAKYMYSLHVYAAQLIKVYRHCKFSSYCMPFIYGIYIYIDYHAYVRCAVVYEAYLNISQHNAYINVEFI